MLGAIRCGIAICVVVEKTMAYIVTYLEKYVYFCIL